MPDSITYDPRDFNVDELIGAARGGHPKLKPQVAIALLRAKLGDEAEDTLVQLADDESLDARARHAAVSQLGSFPTARGTLARLAQSADPLVAEGAAEAMRG